MAKVAKKTSFIDKIYDSFPEDFVVTEETSDDVSSLDVIQTGSTSLDVSLGIGGIPLGRITTIFGPESSAKTTLCLSLARNAIQKGYSVLYIDQENSLDFNYIKAIIGDFDPSKFTLIQPESAEDTVKICTSAVQSGEYRLIILDSVAAMSPEKEREDEFDKAQVGIIPRLIAKFLRINMHGIKKNKVAFVFVNQVRSVIGSYIPTMEMPGGHALRHFSSIIIYISRSTMIKFGEEVVGALSRYTIKKSKVGVPFRTFTFPLMYGKGIDKSRDTIEFAEHLMLLDKRGSYYYLNDECLGQGLAKATEYLDTHKETLDRVVGMCYNTVNKKERRIVIEDESGIDSSDIGIEGSETADPA